MAKSLLNYQKHHTHPLQHCLFCLQKKHFLCYLHKRLRTDDVATLCCHTQLLLIMMVENIP